MQIHDQFELVGDYTVGLWILVMFFIKLFVVIDYSRLFSRISYYVDGFPVCMLKWAPHFDCLEKPPATPIWVAFQRMQIYYFNQPLCILWALFFCKLFQVDVVSAKLSRLSVTRVQIEMGVTAPLDNILISYIPHFNFSYKTFKQFLRML